MGNDFEKIKRITHAPLFAGINGFGLAANWMGWEQLFHCEIDEFCQIIIQYYWPKSKPHYDIRETDFKIYANKINVLTGGFPCQPYSLAGIRKGKDDSRHLWPEMLRAIREIKPDWIVGENVYGIVNWNGGLVFEEIQNDLEIEGYEVQPVLLPALSVGADHIRERVWFIAYAKCLGREYIQSNKRSSFKQINDTKRRRKKKTWWNKKTDVLDSSCNTFLRFEQMYSEPPFFTMDDGIPSKLDGITFPKWIEESLRAAGNAIVPQVAYEIFRIINYFEKTKVR